MSKAGIAMREEERLKAYLITLGDADLRRFCYQNKVGSFTLVTSLVFDELKRRGALSLQFFKSYNHKWGDLINSSLAGKRVCYAPDKDGCCYSPMESDQAFMEAFGLKFMFKPLQLESPAQNAG